MTSCVYIIENSAKRGKVYIGSAKSLKDRESNHWKLLAAGRHHSIKLQRSYNKYGRACFNIRPLLYCSPYDLLFYEQRAIDLYNAATDGYNMNPTAGSNFGRKWSYEVRKKMSLSRKGRRRHQPSGRKATQEHKQNISNALKGKVRTPEHCAAISAAKIGAVISPETRAKMSAARIGKKQSQETIEKRNASLARIRATIGIRVNGRSPSTGKFLNHFSETTTTETPR